MRNIERLDVVLAMRRLKSKELAEAIGRSEQKRSAPRSDKTRRLWFSTLTAFAGPVVATTVELLGGNRDHRAEASGVGQLAHLALAQALLR